MQQLSGVPDLCGGFARGGSGTFSIRWDWEPPDPGGICFINCTEASCSDPGFIVRSSAAWLSGTNRNGVRVDYTAQAHTGTASRSGTLTVAGATFTVTQHPPGPCPSSPDRVSPTSSSFPAATRAACETPGAFGLAQSSILLVNTHSPWIADWMPALEDRRHAERWK